MSVDSRSPEARDQDERWALHVERHGGEPDPFARHADAFREIFAGRRPEDGPPVAWRPDAERIARSNLTALMAERGQEEYAALHRWSATDREGFWACVLRRLGIVWKRPASRMLDLRDGPTHPVWAPDARLNCVDSCFRAPADRVAVIAGGEQRSGLQRTTYRELERLARKVAGGLVAAGLRPSDAVALYMPMTLECVAAYLGIVRAGCRVVSVADSFSAAEVARRLEIGEAVAVVTVDRFIRAGRSIELYAKLREARAPRAIVIASDPGAPPALRSGDFGWDVLLASGEAAESTECAPDDVTNVLFSSGTTAQPKAIPWTHLTPLKCAMDGHYHHDIHPDDVVAWPTNVGWMMGPWLIYATLINGATMALYEGAPGGAGFLRFVERAGVTMLGVVPSLVRAWRALDAFPASWSRMRAFSSTGEPSAQQDYLWLMSRAGFRAPVIEYCGGTEIGGGYITGTVLQPASPATFTTPALGLDLVLLDEGGRPAAPGSPGEVYLVPPSIGLSETLLNADHEAIYHAGCPAGPRGEPLRRHGDRMIRLHRGFFRSQGRADDTMNLGGIKVGSLELERVLQAHPAVSECAAVGVQLEGEGVESLVVFVVPRGEVDMEELRAELGRRLARELNPLFRIHDLVAVERLPYTASNKLMRRTLRDRYRP